MRCLVGVLVQGPAEEVMCRFWVKGEIELILPDKFKTGMGIFIQRNVPTIYNEACCNQHVINFKTITYNMFEVMNNDI